MILVRVDAQPPDLWRLRVPAQCKARAPRLVHERDGSDVRVFEGRQIPNVGPNAVAGPRPDVDG